MLTTMRRTILTSAFRPPPLLSRLTTRLLGSKVAPGNPPGAIHLFDEQMSLKVDKNRLKQTLTKIRECIGYPTYDITLVLVNDKGMRTQHLESLGEDRPTDILSYPFHNAIKPGVLEPVKFDIPDYYTLGEIYVDVPYVMRACKEDQAIINGENDEYDYNEEEDRGVSRAMFREINPETRINMLLVHGMLHLVGHDHEEDDEYELMMAREEEILRELGMTASSGQVSTG